MGKTVLVKAACGTNSLEAQWRLEGELSRQPWTRAAEEVAERMEKAEGKTRQVLGSTCLAC